MRWNRSTKWGLAAAGAVFYFATAVWLRDSYSPDKGPGADAILLTRPFHRFQDTGFAFVASVARFEDLTDSMTTAGRSPVLLYENDYPLGPGHSRHMAIVEHGHGLYSHWKEIGMIFSTSDNTDPNTNGRRYWVVHP